MKKSVFEPEKAVGNSILEYDRQQLCRFIIKLCEQVKADVGAGAYHGGIFPDNISLDEQGNLAIGSAARDNWKGQELDFLPPELYWNHKPGPASDVYSIGMLLYYAVSGGKLPFDGECRDPQLRRMGGDEFKIPAAAGRRLGDIIKKATAFKAADRYQSMDELRVMAESCLKNLYLKGAPSAETIFSKSDDDLSDIERMMVGIIERGEDQPLPEPEDESEEEQQPEDADNAEKESEETVEPPEEVEENAAESGEEQKDDFALAAEVAREAENSASEIHRPKAANDGRDRVPKLYVEKNPELEPVVLQKQPDITPVVSYTRNSGKERRMQEEVNKRRKRPVIVILVLCAVLVIVAIIFNAVIKNLNRSMETLNGTQTAQTSTTDAADAGTTQTEEEEMPEETVLPTAHVVPEDELLDIEPESAVTPYIPGGGSTTTEDASTDTSVAAESTDGEHRYELIIEDISWTDAQKRCAAKGGHLAVPNDADEFNKLVELAESNGITKIWIGGHREDGKMVWDDGSTSPYEQWAKGEPSYVDSSDGAAEDYVLLWYNNGWYYNDSRNDPCAEFPHMYSGTIAYICEYGD